MSVASRIRDLVEETPFVDTHEHLIEERVRLEGKTHRHFFQCNDWAYLFSHYTDADLLTAGMPPADANRFFSPDVNPAEKYQLVAPWWEKVRHTGYAQAIRHTLRGLYIEEDLTEASAPRIAEKYHEIVRPGFYREIIQKRSNIEYCQVNSLMVMYTETEQPDLLRQDLSIVKLGSGVDPKGVERELGLKAATLEGWLGVIDEVFRRYGKRAVAVKSQSAYSRRLNYYRVQQSVAEPLFARLAAEQPLSPDELKTLQDFLMRYCIGKATEYGLPVKLHTGYYAGQNYMPLERVRQNASDLCGLLQDFPDARFILMHIGYPYQDEMIALAKHYRNVYIDLCWAWIINPAASVRFVKEYLLAAPANKLLTFGGDYIPVEPIYGHSKIARLGLARAIIELLEEGWLHEEETPQLIQALMNGNAHALFCES